MLNLRSGTLFPVWCGGMCHTSRACLIQPNQTSILHHPPMRTLIQHKGQVHLQPSQQALTPDFQNLLWPSHFHFYRNVLNSLTDGQPCQWRASWQLALLGNNTILERMLIPLWGPGIPRSTLGAAATRRLLWNHVRKRNLRCEARQGGPPEGTGQVIHPHGISAWAIICGHCVSQRAVLYTTHQEVEEHQCVWLQGPTCVSLKSVQNVPTCQYVLHHCCDLLFTFFCTAVAEPFVQPLQFFKQRVGQPNNMGPFFRSHTRGGRAESWRRDQRQIPNSLSRFNILAAAANSMIAGKAYLVASRGEQCANKASGRITGTKEKTSGVYSC
jgi:hypothetical protein